MKINVCFGRSILILLASVFLSACHSDRKIRQVSRGDMVQLSADWALQNGFSLATDEAFSISRGLNEDSLTCYALKSGESMVVVAFGANGSRISSVSVGVKENRDGKYVWSNLNSVDAYRIASLTD